MSVCSGCKGPLQGRLILYIADVALDMLQDKCIEEDRDLYQVFIDLPKAFVSITRTAVQGIHKKLGYPEKCVKNLRQFPGNMKESFNAGGTLSDPILLENCVTDGDIPAPKLFAIYFATYFQIASKECPDGFI